MRYKLCKRQYAEENLFLIQYTKFGNKFLPKSKKDFEVISRSVSLKQTLANALEVKLKKNR